MQFAVGASNYPELLSAKIFKDDLTVGIILKFDLRACLQFRDGDFMTGIRIRGLRLLKLGVALFG